MTQERTYLAGEVVALTGARKRVLYLWADAGALQALPDTDRSGRGVHRQFTWREVEIAAVLQAISHFRLPIGEMVRLAEGFRYSLRLGELLADDPSITDDPSKLPLTDDQKEHFARLRRARAGEPGMKLVIVPNIPENHLEPATRRAWQDREFVSLIAQVDEIPWHYHQMLIVDLGLCWKGLQT
jgi:hypothetical protein